MLLSNLPSYLFIYRQQDFASCLQYHKNRRNNSFHCPFMDGMKHSITLLHLSVFPPPFLQLSNISLPSFSFPFLFHFENAQMEDLQLVHEIPQHVGLVTNYNISLLAFCLCYESFWLQTTHHTNNPLLSLSYISSIQVPFPPHIQKIDMRIFYRDTSSNITRNFFSSLSQNSATVPLLNLQRNRTYEVYIRTLGESTVHSCARNEYNLDSDPVNLSTNAIGM